MSGDILDQIDGALWDHESRDSMRWTPPESGRAVQGSRLRVTRLDETGTPVGDPVEVSEGYVTVNLSADTDRFIAALRAVEPVMHRWTSTLKLVGEAALRLATALGIPLGLLGSPYDEHHPRPLKIDGHAYRQRRRARVRRNR